MSLSLPDGDDPLRPLLMLPRWDFMLIDFSLLFIWYLHFKVIYSDWIQFSIYYVNVPLRLKGWRQRSQEAHTIQIKDFFFLVFIVSMN